MDKQMDRWIDDIQTDRQTDRQTNRDIEIDGKRIMLLKFGNQVIKAKITCGTLRFNFTKA